MTSIFFPRLPARSQNVLRTTKNLSYWPPAWQHLGICFLFSLQRGMYVHQKKNQPINIINIEKAACQLPRPLPFLIDWCNSFFPDIMGLVLVFHLYFLCNSIEFFIRFLPLLFLQFFFIHIHHLIDSMGRTEKIMLVSHRHSIVDYSVGLSGGIW